MATHHFEPTVYYTAIGAHEPVLHIESGDTVFTTTVDNAGYDATDTQVTPGGNPKQVLFTSNQQNPAIRYQSILIGSFRTVRLDELPWSSRPMFSIRTM